MRREPPDAQLTHAQYRCEFAAAVQLEPPNARLHFCRKALRDHAERDQTYCAVIYSYMRELFPKEAEDIDKGDAISTLI